MSFPQLRKDPIVDRHVLIAPERARRPTEIEDAGHLGHHVTCAFCEGREAETPPEVYAIRPAGAASNSPGWQVRVVPNLFPAVKTAPGTSSVAELVPGAVFTGYGVHEVVVETPRHETSLAHLPLEQFRDLLTVYRDRLIALRDDPRLAYVQVFKNHGAPAGASVEHAHSQILAVTEVPREMKAELSAASDCHVRVGRCVFCDLIDREMAAGERVIVAGEHVVAVAAWAGRFPYETWLLPRRHASRYDSLESGELADLAFVLRLVLRRLAAVAGDPAYNIVLHTAPQFEPAAHYHWHWEILPRMTGIAGYELATGCYLNPLPPEDAAKQLTTDAHR